MNESPLFEANYRLALSQASYQLRRNVDRAVDRGDYGRAREWWAIQRSWERTLLRERWYGADDQPK